ncbi:uncharacterized protein LY89DRAFT_776094 [Mollisia scopiformis]|uniref:Uncharacterized protein n=1 Tax=Mollisia scopiformis TaxID=149040 RepID=A0A194XV19_MOLSC|nr:uncharacterized protein LY89DRAFT_776094 [Mollisia scopiformis]KUJ23879.1 hypothetical protein LY89DRAFT_776094 [Mollisia scopiformis]
MSPDHLESWVEQQYNEIGFGIGGGGPFIGKSALKQKLINRYPMHKQRIRQLVNAIKHQDQPRSVQASQSSSPATAISSQDRKIAQSPPTSSSKTTLQYAARPLSNLVPATAESEMSPTGSPNSDSGFASFSSDTEHQNENGPSPRNAPTMNFQCHSPKSEDGGATLEVFLSSGSWSKTITKTPEKMESLAQSSSNPKILELKQFISEAGNLDTAPQGNTEDADSILRLQLALLNLPSGEEGTIEQTLIDNVKNAVLFSADVLGRFGQNVLPQYGLLGSSDQTPSTTASDSRLFLNTNVPFSAFVCGVQGSGKSHTTACMVENYLIPSPILGVLQKPLSALVFNFAEYSSGASFRPCELAFLASPGSQLPGHLGVKKVNVLVSPSNYLSLKKLYTQIPGVTVQPFKLRPKDLNISTMLTLMSVDQTQATPLYMSVVRKILRDMATRTAGAFDYREFRRRLDGAKLDKKQKEFLNQRLDLLESYLDLVVSTTSPNFAAGEITIIDLSCPFMDASTACVLFKIGMGLYLESDSTTGKLIVLDEAHKYMTDTIASKALTESLMGVIRQQRHYGARVIISTQEPSISPKLIDLCAITVMHRFTSPEWLDVLQKHILFLDKDGEKDSKFGLLRDIMSLRTGEALVFAPTARIRPSDEAGGRGVDADALFKMRMRKRVTWDGGRSICCV